MSPSTTTQESPLPTFSLTRAAKCLPGAARLPALHYRSFGISFRRVLTDNGACYKSRRCPLCQRLGLRHLRTKPHTHLNPTAKAERFIQTALRNGPMRGAYESSSHRARHLPLWLHQYNWHRPHASLQISAPISRVTLLNNLVGFTARRAHVEAVAALRQARVQRHRREPARRLVRLRYSSVQVSISILSPISTKAGTGSSKPVARSGRLHDLARGVALDGGFGVDHLAHHAVGQFDGNGLAFVEDDFAGQAVFQVFERVDHVSASTSNWLYSASMNTYMGSAK